MLSTTLRQIFVDSGLIVATSLMTALSASATTTTANSAAIFSGTIDPLCAVTTGFLNDSITPKAYTLTAYVVSDTGGVEFFIGSQEASFNCNSDTVNVSVDISVNIPPVPNNTTRLKPEPVAIIYNNDSLQNITRNDATSLTDANWVTDTEGNIKITQVVNGIFYPTSSQRFFEYGHQQMEMEIVRLQKNTSASGTILNIKADMLQQQTHLWQQQESWLQKQESATPIHKPTQDAKNK